MKLDIFLEKTANLQVKAMLWKFTVTALTIALVVNSFYTYKMLSSQRVIVIPAGFNEKVSVSMDSADPQYLRLMTRYVMGLFLNYTEGNIRIQYGELLGLVSPKRYNYFKTLLSDLADKVEQTHLVSVFHIIEIKSKKTGNRYEIEVQGNRTLWSKGVKLEEKTERYLIDAEIKNARFNLLDIKQF